VFVHGFNVGFNDAACRAAQIGFDLQIPGVMGFFSWPSKARMSLTDYMADEATVEASEPYLTEFLTAFAAKSGADRVHVIAHSMGNRGLLRSMERVVARAGSAAGVPFGEVVLAAPDVDERSFRNLARSCTSLAERTTLYASSKDRALASSGILHDHPRAGYTPPVTVVPPIETVEVSNIDFTFLGHGYYAAARDLLHDLHGLLINRSPPPRMGLRPVKTESGERYWMIGA
jgi:esterase/lipase superfamily enzyme